jgi:hypothetical protein
LSRIEASSHYNLIIGVSTEIEQCFKAASQEVLSSLIHDILALAIFACMTPLHGMRDLIVSGLPLHPRSVPLSHPIEHVTEPLLVHYLILLEALFIEIFTNDLIQSLPSASIEFVIIVIAFEFVDNNQNLKIDPCLLKYLIVDFRQFKI